MTFPDLITLERALFLTGCGVVFVAVAWYCAYHIHWSRRLIAACGSEAEAQEMVRQLETQRLTMGRVG